MDDDDSYDMLPHRDIADLKRQVQELQARTQKTSPPELVNALNAVANSMESMLRLFSEAAQELKIEQNQGPEALHRKLDEIIEQNKTIAEGMIAVSDMVKDFVDGQKGRQPMPQQMPRPKMPQQFPGAQSQQFPQDFQPSFQQPPFSQPMQDFSPEPFPQFNDQAPKGPVAMPSMPFSEFDAPKKKGLFGRLKK